MVRMSRVASLLTLLLVTVGMTRADDAGTAPVLDARWSAPTLREEQVRRWLMRDAVKALEDRNRPILHAAEPLAVGGKVLFRSHRGIHAFHLATGKLAWESDSSWSLDVMAREPQKAAALNQWVAVHLGNGRATTLLSNAVLGRLSADGKQVYAVDDLELPPVLANFNNPMIEPHYGYPVNDAVYHSRLQAYNLNTGKLVWEVGSRRGKDELHDSYFLSAPLVHDGKLFVPIEQAGSLALVALDSADGRMIWRFDLAAVRYRLHLDPTRRLHGIRLALADGILVCLLGETLLGVDLESHSVLWAHTPLRETPVAPVMLEQMFPPGLLPARPDAGLGASAPAVVGDHVVFNVPGGKSLVCVGLKDGRVAWRATATRDDVYLAGAVRDRVLLVGRRGIRALNAADGKSLWSVETGEPAGRGAASGTVYHLPLRSESRSKRPGVVTVDVERGEVIAFTRATEDVPGNLVLHERDVLSQTIDRVAVFPQLRHVLKEKDDRVREMPKDPNRLAERGEMRLAAGDPTGAAEDYRAALANAPPVELRPKARTGLYESLTRLLERDFAAGEKHLREYEELCKLEAPPDASREEMLQLAKEERRRKAEMDFLVGRGREQQGRMEDALSAYLRYLALAPEGETALVPGDAGLRMQRFIWVSSRLDTLIEQSPAAQRKKLEETIAEAWKSVRSGTNLDEQRAFARRLGVRTSASGVARLTVASALLREKAYAEAELLVLPLLHSSDAPTAAWALGMMAELSLAQGLPQESAHFYRRLGREFATTKVRDGLTGADLLKNASTDPRLVPFLDERATGWPQKVRVREEKPGDLVPRRRFRFEPRGEPLPWFDSHQIGLDLTDNQLRVTDSSGREEWSHRLPATPFQNFAAAVNSGPIIRNTCRVQGHLIVLTLGYQVFAIDPVGHRLLWERSLLGRESLPPGALVMPDPRDAQPQLVFQDGTTQKLGQVAVVAPGVVCLQTVDGLAGLDPLTGNVLWQRSDVEPGGSLFHDDEFVFLVGPGSSTRAFRLRDGAAVKVPDCSSLFADRLEQIGGRLLLAGQEKGLIVRLYDVRTGKDVWQRSFAAGSRPVRSEDESFAAVLGPDGRVTVMDAVSGKELTVLPLDPAHVADSRDLRLLADALQFYVATDTPPAADEYAGGIVQPNLLPGSGLRSLPVNGWLYAFRRDNGKVAWRTEVEPQHLLLTEFRALPVLILTARGQKLTGSVSNRSSVPFVTATVIDRRTGKVVYQPQGTAAAPYFHALYRDAKGGLIELAGANNSLRVTPE